MAGCAAERANVGGVGALLFMLDGAYTLELRVLMGPGGSFCLRGDAGGRVLSVRRKAFRAASPPLMVQMCVSPCGEGAHCTLHMVSSGRRSESLGDRKSTRLNSSHLG